MFRNLSITSKHLSITNTYLFMTSNVLISSRLFSTTSIRRMDNDNNDISETSKTEKLNSSSNLAEEYNKRRENTKILHSEFTVQSHKLRALATKYKNLSEEKEDLLSDEDRKIFDEHEKKHKWEDVLRQNLPNPNPFILNKIYERTYFAKEKLLFYHFKAAFIKERVPDSFKNRELRNKEEWDKKEEELISTSNKIMSDAAKLHDQKHDIKDEIRRRIVEDGQSLVAEYADPNDQQMENTDPD